MLLFAVKAEREADYRNKVKAQLTSALDLPKDYWQSTWGFTDINDAMTSLNAHGKKLPDGMTSELLKAVNKLVGGWSGRDHASRCCVIIRLPRCLQSAFAAA